MKKIICYAIAVVSLGVFLYAGYQLFGIYQMYHEADQTFEQVESVALQPVTTEKKTEEQDDYPSFAVDFEKLWEINPDVVGWIYLEPLEISYPILQGKNNDQYLRRDIYGNYSKPGCIFLEASASAEFDDENAIVYGHNMKNSSMFGSLKKFYQEDGFIEKCPYFYVITPSAIRKYEIFGYEHVSPTDEIYDMVGDIDEEAFFKKVSSKALWFREPKLAEEEKPEMLMLSTCYGDSSSRFLVHGRCIEQKEVK